MLGVSAGMARMSLGMPGMVRGRFGGVDVGSTWPPSQRRPAVRVAHAGRTRWLARQEGGGGRRQAGSAGLSHRWLG